MYTTVVSLTETPKGSRIYLNGKYLLKSGFSPATSYEVEIATNRITLRASAIGSRRVSSKRDNTVPVIDLQNSALSETFGRFTKLQVEAGELVITITPAHIVQRISERKRDMTEGSLFSGGGLMTEAAASLGFEPRFALELDPRYAEIYSHNHPTADIFATSVEEVSFESLSRYRGVSLLSMGIPCECFSQARSVDRGTSAKRDKTLPPEAHENGDMTYFAIRTIDATNPYMVVIEESPNYLKSGAGWILRHAMKRMGYYVDARVVSPVDYGELQQRRRAIIIGRTDGPVEWPIPVTGTKTIHEILESPEVEGEWFTRATKSWLFNHWDTQTAKGNGFASQVISENSTSVGTIKKRYLAQQGDNPVLAHPILEGTYRFFTLKEIKRLMGLPDDYYLGDGGKTISGEVCGQGAVVSTVREIIAVNYRLREGVSAVCKLSVSDQPVLIEPTSQMDLFAQTAA